MQIARPGKSGGGPCTREGAAGAGFLPLSALAVLLLLGVAVPAWSQTARAAEGPLSSDQKKAVESLGYPDTFTIMSAAVDRDDPERLFRVESWNYGANRQAVVFIEGELRGEKELSSDASELGTKTEYRPDQFTLGATIAEVEERVLGPGAMDGFGLDADDPEYQGVEHGELQLGFELGRLVYVDTTPDFADDEREGGS